MRQVEQEIPVTAISPVKPRPLNPHYSFIAQSVEEFASLMKDYMSSSVCGSARVTLTNVAKYEPALYKQIANREKLIDQDLSHREVRSHRCLVNSIYDRMTKTVEMSIEWGL